MSELPTTPYDLFGLYRAALDLRRNDGAMDDRVIRCYHELIHNWTTQDRHYHTLVVHLQPMIRRIVADGEWGWNRRALVLAAFYHDAVMDFSKPDHVNVRDSVALWEKHLGYILDDQRNDIMLKDVTRHILSTDYSRPIDPEYVALRNHDLAPLAGSWKEYTRNGNLIKTEQQRRSCGAAIWTPKQEKDYLFDQLDWLTDLLRSPRIFFLDDDDETELMSRVNLGRHLAEVIAALQPLRSDRV
jgi:predicted metal-dependent HD superfamily phosphohydrolase